jgi:hypothetical protein
MGKRKARSDFHFPASRFGSALEGNKAPESRIRKAVLSGFDVTREPVFESRVSVNPDNGVVPAMELMQRQLVFKRLVGPETLRVQIACISIEYADLGVFGSEVGDSPFD